MNKYGNRKVQCDGMTFDSKKEYTRWCELRLLERAGEIENLERQVPFEIIPKQTDGFGRTVRGSRYIADFVYVEGGKMVVEDCKGMRTDVYRLKKKLMLYRHGITVRET